MSVKFIQELSAYAKQCNVNRFKRHYVTGFFDDSIDHCCCCFASHNREIDTPNPKKVISFILLVVLMCDSIDHCKFTHTPKCVSTHGM